MQKHDFSLQKCHRFVAKDTLMLTHPSGWKAHGSHYCSFVLVYRALVPLQKTQNQYGNRILIAKNSFVLVYRALVPLQKTQNQIYPAPQATILRICTSKCKILPAPQAKILPIYTSQMQNPIGNRHITRILSLIAP